MALACLLAGTAPLYAQSSIVNTKHNLSISGPGAIKATTESEVCVFCHTPHSRNQTTQLWNHQLTTANYLLYNSDYLTSISYSAASQPGSRSRVCLACHDGTVALGTVYNTPGAGGNGSIAISGGITQLPAGNANNVGTNLANDHPVGFTFDWTKDIELVNRSFPWPGQVLLSPNSPAGTVECTTCHNAHSNQYPPFLATSNADAALCISCHNKTGWSSAIHKISTQAYTPPGSALTTIGEWSCRNCHESHGGAGIPYLLIGSEENTCYQAGCHGSTSKGANTKDIQTQADKAYRHPTNTVSGKHANPDNTVSLRTPNRHAECSDCHNAHQAQKGLHTLKSNTISGVLAGVSGVTAGSASAWSQPMSFTVINPATQEWQICYKCHAYNGLGVLTTGVSTITGPSGTLLTDQAWEFNPANRSAHPVQVALNSMTGSLTTKALATSQMTAAWNTVGTQSMYCADCHGADAATSSAMPQGPHGSSAKNMLTGSGKYWPTNASGGLWTLADIRNNSNNWSADLFCANCHPMITGSTFVNNVHNRSDHRNATIYCITCHVTVPHGAQRSRLIGYASEAAPWNYGGSGNAKLLVTGFRKASRNSYNKDNCNFPKGVCHGSQSGTFEN